MVGPIYRVSEAGRRAWESKDLSVPSDYRTILWIMDFHGAEHLQALARLFPEQNISDCLAEMEELGLVEPDPVARPGEAHVKAHTPPEVVSVGPGDLPAARHALSAAGAYVAQHRQTERPRATRPAAQTTILIVEDDADQLALADLRVSMAGYGVRVANSQRALLQSIAEQGVPDLLLLDVALPDGDGFEILRRLRRLPSFAELPIVMLTAKATPDDIMNGLTWGADGYITKPYSKNILATVIRRVLGHG